MELYAQTRIQKQNAHTLAAHTQPHMGICLNCLSAFKMKDHSVCLTIHMTFVVNTFSIANIAVLNNLIAAFPDESTHKHSPTI